MFYKCFNTSSLPLQQQNKKVKDECYVILKAEIYPVIDLLLVNGPYWGYYNGITFRKLQSNFEKMW